MVKATAMENKNLNPKTLSIPKDGFIQKKKSQKFKQTPTGKVSLINGSKISDNNNMKKQSTSPKKFSMKLKEQNKVNSPKTNKTQPPKKESNKKGLNKSKANESDSEEDINEGVVLKEEELMEETDDTESEEESEEESDEDVQEKKIPNILGTSLADDTEEDDEEFKITNEKGKLEVNKGVKMFKGLKSSSKGNNSVKSSDTSGNETSLVDDSDEDEDDDEEEMEDDDEEEDDDEDVEEGEDDDGDEEEEDDDDDDDDDDDESENEAEESVLGTKALLGQSLADDDDDEDFVEPEGHEEDDDISDEDEEEGEGDNSTLNNSNQSNNSKDEDSSFEHLNADGKTIFVGNLPKEVTDKQLKKLFKKFGAIDTIRIRGIVPESPGISKKVAAITKKIHPKVQTVYAYIKFVSEESAKAALSLNGIMFEGNHLRVDEANKSEKKYDAKRSVFLGNLPFKVDTETVWKHFEKCGEIESVHVVKDNKTGLSKGIGYVNFKTEDAVALAFELNGTMILNRKVMVKPYLEQSKNKYRKRSHSGETDKHGSPRKQFKQYSGKPVAAQSKDHSKKAEMQQKVDKKHMSAFQGQKADKDKKKPESKVDKKKKILAKKLTAKPKKPRN